MVTELFKQKPKAFKHLATAEDLLFLSRVYDEYFNDTPDDDGQLIDPRALLPSDLQDTGLGDLGMDVEYSLTPADLATHLGFTKQRLPHQFNNLRHALGLTPWADGILFSTKPTPDCLKPNALHWHQLAGIHSITRSIFTTSPDPHHCTGVLIADEVGLGKTAQSLSLIAFLNQCIFLQ